ncbi:hypothetical protein [Pseudoalteromonas denitrificans]|jgi:hypothetical protein|uniref:Uncharacterized protein n=1 Tax=Pseudoalteromonas denitrificans DSM 6059 TaxID=1123010 RepID=A0A1I1S219_9GAMM|nr:hypothetical protein [Pseudoalteromonas denitrificans]SFD37000.1 hypothetical protein SAMN02745724_04319 [Pseudoalteromonas denitrificans DSM 6059]
MRISAVFSFLVLIFMFSTEKAQATPMYQTVNPILVYNFDFNEAISTHKKNKNMIYEKVIDFNAEVRSFNYRYQFKYQAIFRDFNL